MLIRRSPGRSTAPILKDINLMMGVNIKRYDHREKRRTINLNANSIAHSHFHLFLLIGKNVSSSFDEIRSTGSFRSLISLSR